MSEQPEAAVQVPVLVAGLGLVALLLRNELDGQFEQRALASAHAVTADPAFAAGVTAGPPVPAGIVQTRAEEVRRRTGALFVVVTDDRGLRYSHPNADLIGQRVSTDPSVALGGRDAAVLERGTLGLSARGETPLRDATGRIVGEVSVGIEPTTCTPGWSACCAGRWVSAHSPCSWGSPAPRCSPDGSSGRRWGWSPPSSPIWCSSTRRSCTG